MAYGIKVTINNKRVFVGNERNGILVPQFYATKAAAKLDIDKYLAGKGLQPSICKYPPASKFPK